MNDAGDNAPVIDWRNTARIGRQMWLDLRELVPRQPEKMLAHQRSPSGNLESRFARCAKQITDPDLKEDKCAVFSAAAHAQRC